MLRSPPAAISRSSARIWPAHRPLLPYPTQLGETQVLLGGEPMPLQYAGTGQINAVVPFDVPVNTPQQLIVEQNGVSSLPETVVIAAAQPAVFTQDQSGMGAGAIVVVKANGSQFPNTPGAPAAAGDALVIYCTGREAVTPAIPTGSAAPFSPLSTTANSVTVTIGGQPAQVLFAGLAPGYVGLYQVNAIVPAGISPGPNVSVILSAAGAMSPPVTVAIQ
jgi:uncharacterized protein (TIGR03437 family)